MEQPAGQMEHVTWMIFPYPTVQLVQVEEEGGCCQSDMSGRRRQTEQACVAGSSRAVSGYLVACAPVSSWIPCQPQATRAVL